MSIIPDIWFGILVLELLLYLVLDGADLGVGVLTVWQKNDHIRTVMMRTIGPVWDANETWLLVAGATLFGAFPGAYAAILGSVLAWPVMLMVFGLMTRAVAFEFHRHGKRKRLWGALFSASSLAAVLGQAFTVSGLLSGAVQRGTVGALFSPFSFELALGIIAGYVLLGYAYLARHTESSIKRLSFFGMRVAAVVSFLLCVLVLILLPSVYGGAAERWFSIKPLYLALLALLALCYAMVFTVSRRPTAARSPYWWSVGCVVLASAFVVLTVYPHLVPGVLTIAQAAATIPTMRFMLIGIIPLIPIIIFYNVYAHRVFGGSVEAEELYEDEK